MKVDKFVLLVVTAITSFTISADDWHGSDKVKHFAVSAAIGAGGTVLAQRASIDDPERVAMAACVAIGAAKEAYDKRPSIKDLVFDVAGCTLGGFVVMPFRDGIYFAKSFEFK